MKTLTMFASHWLDTIRNKHSNSASAGTQAPALECYTVAVPAELLARQPELLDQIISFALDTLKVRYLDVRICNDA